MEQYSADQWRNWAEKMCLLMSGTLVWETEELCCSQRKVLNVIFLLHWKNVTTTFFIFKHTLTKQLCYNFLLFVVSWLPSNFDVWFHVEYIYIACARLPLSTAILIFIYLFIYFLPRYSYSHYHGAVTSSFTHEGVIKTCCLQRFSQVYLKGRVFFGIFFIIIKLPL